MKVKYLTFDCYGTLIDWRAGIEHNFKICFDCGQLPKGIRLLDRYVALEVEEEKSYKPYSEVLKDTAAKLADGLGVIAPKNAGERFAGSIITWPAFADTAETLKELGRRGYKRVILSNIDRSLLEETLENNDLEVDGVVTAQDVKSYKPNRGHWVEFLRRYQAKKEETLHVANSVYHDIIPATSMGIKTVWVNRYSERTPNSITPSYTVDKLSELLTILNSKEV